MSQQQLERKVARAAQLPTAKWYCGCSGFFCFSFPAPFPYHFPKRAFSSRHSQKVRISQKLTSLLNGVFSRRRLKKWKTLPAFRARKMMMSVTHLRACLYAHTKHALDTHDLRRGLAFVVVCRACPPPYERIKRRDVKL